uniref:D-xylose 1-dehydrogenase (NADP(+), D-xylono-1,5-lactone-forming) n=1 Tax=Neobodo designis TaxID=312471 RepID=A0A7S1M2X9_NEODS
MAAVAAVGESPPAPALRWGILSTASILKHFVPAVAAAPGQSVVAVASRTLEKAAQAAKTYAIPHAEGSYEALLARPDINAVYVPLPVDMHLEWVTKALSAGKHVLVEKPIALNPGDVATMHAAARAANLLLAEGYMSLHTAQQRHLEATFAATNPAPSPIGRLLSIRSQFAYPLSRRGFREDPAASGGGSLWDVGCYCVALGQTLAGRLVKPSSITAVAHRLRRAADANAAEKQADVLLSATITYENGVVHTFECGLVGTARVGCELIGTAGRAVLAAPFKPPLADATITIEKLSGEPGAVVVDAQTVKISEDATADGGATGHLYRWQLDRFRRAYDAANARGADGPAVVAAFLQEEEVLSTAIVATVRQIHECSTDVDFGASRL